MGSTQTEGLFSQQRQMFARNRSAAIYPSFNAQSVRWALVRWLFPSSDGDRFGSHKGSVGRHGSKLFCRGTEQLRSAVISLWLTEAVSSQIGRAIFQLRPLVVPSTSSIKYFSLRNVVELRSGRGTKNKTLLSVRDGMFFLPTLKKSFLGMKCIFNHGRA